MNVSNLIIQKAELICQSLGKDKELLSPEFRLKLDEILAKLEEYKTHALHTPEKTARQVVQLFHNLDDNLEHLKINPTTAKRVHERLLRAEKSILKGLEKTEEPQTTKVDCRLAFFCDLDAPDYNGAIACSALDALQHNLPFITTASLFSEIHNKKKYHSPSISLTDHMENYHDAWRVYQTGGFLIFLPEKTVLGLSEQDGLAAFGLCTDGSLSRISPKKIVQSQTKATIEAFFQLFSADNKKSKLIWLAGHGGVGRPGGLTTDHYRELLKFFSTQHCLGLTETTCYAGGTSSLLHLPSHPEEEQQLKFPVILRSIGDFPTHAHEPAEKNVSLYFDQLQALLESPGGQTLRRFKKMVETVEGGKAKPEVNLIQVYFPPAKDSPGGFRPIGEGGKSYALTFGKMRQSQHRAHQLSQPPIAVKDRDFLEIHPLIVDAPLRLEGRHAIPLSLIPGPAHHYIDQLELPALPRLIEKIEAFYKNNEHRAPKAFFIRKVKDKQTTSEQCILFIHPEGVSCLFRQGNSYFSSDALEREISMFQYLTVLMDWFTKTIPSDEAIRSQTGGQQSEQEFIQMISSPDFWGSHFDRFVKLLTLFTPSLLDLLKGIEFLEICSSQLDAFKPEDFAELATTLIHSQRGDLVRLLIETKKVTPDTKNGAGCPLIVSAALKQDMALVRYLLDQGANVNAADGNGMTALHVAAKEGNRELTALLLSHPQIEIDAKDRLQLTPLYYARQQPVTFTLLKSKGASLDSEDKEQFTFLSRAAFKKDLATINRLLEMGANPNCGHPSALIWAIRHRDEPTVELMLKHGADPFREESGALFEALDHRNPAIIALYLNQIPFNPNLRDQKGRTPLYRTLSANNASLTETLLQRGGVLRGPNDSLAAIKRFLQLKLEAGDFSLLKLLWQYKEQQPPDVQDMIYALYLRTISRSDLENEPYPPSPGLFVKKSIELAREGEQKYSHLIEFLLQIGIDIDQPLDIPQSNKKTPFQMAVEYKALSVIKKFIQIGADPRPYFRQIIGMGDLSLIQLAVEKGAQVTPDGQYNPLFYVAGLDRTGAVVKAMVARGADLNFVGQHPTSPFGTVLESGNLKLCDFCLEHGAKISQHTPSDYAKGVERDPKGKILPKLISAGMDIKGKKGAPIALKFIKEGNVEGFRFCLEQGVRLSQEDAPVAFKGAFAYASFEMIKLLEKHGLKFSLKMTNGDDILTAYDLEKAPLFEYLVEHGFTPDKYPVITGDLLKAMIKNGDVSSFKTMLSYPYVITYIVKNYTKLMEQIRHSSKMQDFIDLIVDSEVNLFFNE